MCFQYLENKELKEALAIFTIAAEAEGRQPKIEKAEASKALGRITAGPVYARICSPHYNAAAMDGIAVPASRTFGATDTTPVYLKGTEYVRVDTGDPLPEGMDAVIMVEDIVEAGEGVVKLSHAASPWQHVRQIGEDICQGDMLLPSYTRITPAAIGALLAGGISSLDILSKPVVGIIPTGDEMIPPTDAPRCGEIIEFNSAIFSAMLKEWGAVSRVYPIVPDNLSTIKEDMLQASKDCDIVLVNAGSSAGREDYTALALSQAGTLLVHGIAIRPGKPTILGLLNQKPFVGVPGYPVSGMNVMENIVRPLLDWLNYQTPAVPQRVEAILTRNLMSSLKYREFIRVKLGKVGEKLTAVPLHRGAGVVTSIVKADGILEVPLNTEGLEAGTRVYVNLLKPAGEIEKTLVITGSHDPLIDTAADLMRRKYRHGSISSSHVGSIGGIMALKRKETHLAGIHLLDEENGEYNTGFIRRYFKGERIARIHCVERIQGLMVARGNPKGIGGLERLQEDGIRFVNRQRGSGTRILLDYLLRQQGMDPKHIYGYTREEFTHTGVAALIASGSADVGLGIYTAARSYHLDFIPLAEETYDLIISEDFLNMEQVQRFVELIRSRDFKKALTIMGGYRFDKVGETTLFG